MATDHYENQVSIENYNENDEKVTITASLQSASVEKETHEDISIAAVEPSISQNHDCDFCDQLFENDVELTKHIEEWHQVEEKYKNAAENGEMKTIPTPDEFGTTPIDKNNIYQIKVEFPEPVKVEDIKIDEDYNFPSLNHEFEEILLKTESAGCGFENYEKEGKDREDLQRANRGKKNFRCGQENCKATFSIKSKLLRHLHVHTGARPFMCSIEDCKKAYTEKSSLDKHMRLHGIHKPFKCPHQDCQASFKHEKYLKAHLMHHSNGLLECHFDGCKKIFKRIYDLKTHLPVHSNAKPFKCQYKDCQAVFKFQKNLEVHTKLHDGGKVFKCNVMDCYKTFKYRKNLNYHMDGHTEDRPFECSIPGCLKKFKRNEDLKDHLRNHRNSRTFVCDYSGCGKSYKRNYALSLHKKTHVSL